MKNYSFEGARVVFCLIVFLNHWTMLFMPDLPIVIFNDGNLAVVFFLLLCGFVSPISIWNGTNNKNGGGRRFIRFYPVIFTAIMLTWSIQKIPCDIVRPYLFNALKLPLANNYYEKHIDFFSALIETVIDSFIGRPLLDTPLWTIKYEFWGYIIIRKIALNRIEKRRIFFMCGAVLGLLARDICTVALFVGAEYSNEFYNNKRVYKVIADEHLNGVFLILIGVFLLGNCFMNNKLVRLIIVLLIFTLLVNDSKLSNVFSKDFLTKFSNLTYPFYAFHWPIVYSIGGGIVVILTAVGFPYKMALTLSFIGALTCTVVLVILYKQVSSLLMCALRKEKWQ